MDEFDLLEALKSQCDKFNAPAPADVRQHLVTNPYGRKWKDRSVEAIQGLVVHQALGWHSVENIAVYHTGRYSHLYSGGVESIAYTFAIRRDGEIVLCNDLNKATWSQGYVGRAGDENAQFLSVMVEGEFCADGYDSPSAGEPTAKQIASLMHLWVACRTAWRWPNGALYGHYHFGKKHCPGDTLKSTIEAIRR
jgi:hypothetical protein